MRDDLVWFKFFLEHFNGVSVIPTVVRMSDPELFARDACLVCEFFHTKFPSFIVRQPAGAPYNPYLS